MKFLTVLILSLLSCEIHLKKAKISSHLISKSKMKDPTSKLILGIFNEIINGLKKFDNGKRGFWLEIAEKLQIDFENAISNLHFHSNALDEATIEAAEKLINGKKSGKRGSLSSNNSLSNFFKSLMSAKNTEVAKEGKKLKEHQFNFKAINIVQSESSGLDSFQRLNNSVDKVMSYMRERVDQLSSLTGKEVLTKIGKELLKCLRKDTGFNFNFERKGMLNLSFLALQNLGAEDSTPPKLYESDVLCKNPGECLGKKLLWNKCQVLSVAARMAYETYNMIYHKLVPIGWALCACSGSPSDKDIKIKCNNKSGQPGIPCNIAVPVLKVLFKVSYGLWNVYQMLANMCKVPTMPLL